MLRRLAVFGITVLASLIAMSIARPVSAAVWTDGSDYPPGSRVVIHGDNSDDAAFSANEVIRVAVRGPRGYTTDCRTVSDPLGSWSCAITLRPGEVAFGTYTYTVEGLGSGVTEVGTFSSAKTWHETRLTDLRPTQGVHGASVTATARLHVDQCSRYVCAGGEYCTSCRLDAVDPAGLLVKLSLGVFSEWVAADETGKVAARLPVPRNSEWLEASFSGSENLPRAFAQQRLTVRRLRDMPEVRAYELAAE